MPTLDCQLGKAIKKNLQQTSKIKFSPVLDLWVEAIPDGWM